MTKNNNIGKQIEAIEHQLGKEENIPKCLRLADKLTKLYAKSEKCSCCHGYGYVAKKGE